LLVSDHRTLVSQKPTFCEQKKKNPSIATAVNCRSNRGIVETLAGHNGPITGVHQHPSTGEHDFGDLLLSSSTDWTIKLWSRSVRGAALRG
jgi:hypothetical protein